MSFLHLLDATFRLRLTQMLGHFLWQGAAVLLAVGVPLLAQSRAAPNDAAPPESKKAATGEGRPYDHFFYVSTNDADGAAQTDSLVMVKVTVDGFQQREVFTQTNLSLNWQPLFVCGGKLYALKYDEFIAIDLASGKAEKMEGRIASRTFQGGLLFAQVFRDVKDSVLRVFDVAKGACRDVAPIDFNRRRRPAQPYRERPPIAASPDLTQLAFFDGLDIGKGLYPNAFRLNLIDVKTGKGTAVGPEVHSMTFSTGGGDRNDGPPFVWLDPQMILLVHDVKGQHTLDIPSRPKVVVYGPDSPPWLAVVDVTNGTMTDVLTLPKWQRRFGEPYLRPLGADGVPGIVLGELGQYRIDLKAKRLVEDDTMGGDYRYSRGRQPERLLWGKTLLWESGRGIGPVRDKRIYDLSVSPDGRGAVWFTKLNPSAELYYHGYGEQEVRVVVRGWFHRSWEPDANSIFWATADELAPAAPAEPPEGWQRWPAAPYPEPPKPREPDKRPNVADLLTLSISTDKKDYQLHEPVQLTVTLRNTTDHDVKFPRPREYSDFFILTMKAPRTIGMIQAFERYHEVFATDPVVIKAGESFQCTRTLETDYPGVHRIEGSLSNRLAEWRGEFRAAPLTFTVEKSAAAAELLNVKFARLIALCRQECQKDPMTCDYARMFGLGPDGVPLLVAELEASTDVKFRQRMGYALAQMATADALPYFEKLLQGDMIADQRMVLDGLLEMVRRNRAADRAQAVLISALKHRSEEVRKGAAERLREIHDPQVKAAMEDALEGPAGPTAARYLAAYEGLDLADWLAATADKPTPARYLAARSIVAELDRTWETSKGQLPAVSWEQAAKEPAALEQFRQTMRAWQSWARENPRHSAHFFDADRERWPKNLPRGDPR